VFTPSREGSVDAVAGLVHRWQFVGPALPDEFYLTVFLTIGGASQEDTNVTVSFTGLVLGPRELAMSVLSERFPELGLAATELSEMSWVESAAQFAGLGSAEELTSRVSKTKHYGKNKSDYVRQPVARDALAAILRYLSAGPAGYVILDPYGGAMARAGATDTPFPHRAGNLYGVQYGVTWDAGDDGEARMAWLRALYAYMAPHVSSGPRAAYVNYIVLPPAAGDAARWRSATNTTRSGTHDVALGLSRANFVDLNRTRESGAAKRCSLFGYALYYLFSVLTRSETHDHPATRARAATRPPNARERSSCTTWR